MGFLINLSISIGGLAFILFSGRIADGAAASRPSMSGFEKTAGRVFIVLVASGLLVAGILGMFGIGFE